MEVARGNFQGGVRVARELDEEVEEVEITRRVTGLPWEFKHAANALYVDREVEGLQDDGLAGIQITSRHKKGNRTAWVLRATAQRGERISELCMGTACIVAAIDPGRKRRGVGMMMKTTTRRTPSHPACQVLG